MTIPSRNQSFESIRRRCEKYTSRCMDNQDWKIVLISLTVFGRPDRQKPVKQPCTLYKSHQWRILSSRIGKPWQASSIDRSRVSKRCRFNVTMPTLCCITVQTCITEVSTPVFRQTEKIVLNVHELSYLCHFSYRLYHHCIRNLETSEAGRNDTEICIPRYTTGFTVIVSRIANWSGRGWQKSYGNCVFLRFFESRWRIRCVIAQRKPRNRNSISFNSYCILSLLAGYNA